MNNDAKFEKRLRNQAMKTVPNEWRAEILREAARAAESQSRISTARASWLEILRSKMVVFLWPAPRAWAGLASVWVIILVMNLSGRHDSESGVLTASVSAAQARTALKQKQLLMAELAGNTETREAVPTQPTSPRPRSQQREKASAA